MKSKISFFKPTIFKKNVTLYWPIWTIFLVYLLIKGPILLWASFRSSELSVGDLKEDALYAIFYSTDMLSTTIMIFIFAAIVGMALFSYLYNPKSANMMHSLPVTRGQLYGTNVISGLAFLWVPHIISFLLSVVVCVSYGVTDVKYLAIWLVAAMGMSFIFFSIVAFCAMFTGQMFALPIYYFIVNFLYLAVYLIISMVIAVVSFGFDFPNLFSDIKLSCLSPAYYLVDKVNFEPVYNVVREYDYSTSTLEKLNFMGGSTIAWYCVAAVAIFILGYILYKIRKIEDTGNILTIDFLKPVFRWGLGACAGFMGGLLVYAIFTELQINVNRVVFFIAIAIIGGLFFFFAQMFIDKSFKVFKKKRLLECLIFIAFMLAIYLSIVIGAKIAESNVPDADEIAEATLEADYGIKYQGNFDEIVDLHNMINEQRDNYFAHRNEGRYYISIRYILRNGDVISRAYELPDNEESAAILDKIKEIEESPEFFYTSYVKGGIPDAMAESGYFSNYTEGYEYIDGIDIDSEVAKALDAAVQADSEAGVLAKYNLYWLEDDQKGYTADIQLDYGSDKHKVDDGFYYDGVHYQLLRFGPDCKNIIETLIEYGLITSEDDLIIDSGYERIEA